MFLSINYENCTQIYFILIVYYNGVFVFSKVSPGKNVVKPFTDKLYFGHCVL